MGRSSVVPYRNVGVPCNHTNQQAANHLKRNERGPHSHCRSTTPHRRENVVCSSSECACIVGVASSGQQCLPTQDAVRSLLCCQTKVLPPHTASVRSRQGAPTREAEAWRHQHSRGKAQKMMQGACVVWLACTTHLFGVHPLKHTEASSLGRRQPCGQQRAADRHADRRIHEVDSASTWATLTGVSSHRHACNFTPVCNLPSTLCHAFNQSR